MHPANCLNCNSNLDEDFKFCPKCGQKAAIHRLDFHAISHDAVHYVTHADKSIFTLIKELISKPGIVAREYVAGRRQRYFKPLNFFLIVAGIVVFMTSSFYSAEDNRSRQIELAANKIQDPVKRQETLNVAARTKTVNKITKKYSNVINMVATPLLTFLFWIFYRKKYNYFESLVANMYFIGFIMLLYALVIVPLQSLFPRFTLYFIALFFLFEIVYRGMAYYQLINQKGRRQAAKAYGVSFLVSFVWVLITYSVIYWYIRNGF